MKERLWKSGDRVTVWSKQYSRTALDGRVEIYTVERVRVKSPSRQQLRIRNIGGNVGIMTVVPRDSHSIAPQTTYYVMSQSFHGGPDARGDMLGGFCSGRMYEVFSKTYQRNMKILRATGFKLAKGG